MYYGSKADKIEWVIAKRQTEYARLSQPHTKEQNQRQKHEMNGKREEHDPMIFAQR